MSCSSIELAQERLVRRILYGNTAHAPVGGSDVAGKHFAGGEFVPGKGSEGVNSGSGGSEGSSPKEFHFREGSNEDKFKAHSYLQNAYKNWYDNLSDDEKRSALIYSGNAYSDMNGALRAGRVYPIHLEKDPNIEKRINDLKEALHKSSAPDDLITFRGISDTEGLFGVDLGNIDSIIGKVYEDKAFLSMTLDRREAEGFNKKAFGVLPRRGALLRINVPKGSKVASLEVHYKLSGPEDFFIDNIYNEMVGYPGHKLKVKSIDKSSEHTIIDCELIGPES